MTSLIPVFHGKGSMSSLEPFDGCSKRKLYAKDKRKRCSRWEWARRRPHLWTPERIAKDCADCRYWQSDPEVSESD